MTVANVFTFAAVATQFRDRARSFAKSCVLTRNHFDVAQNARPARSAGTLIGLIDLLASGTVETRSLARLAGEEQLRSRVRDAAHGTPVDEALATRSGETVRTVA